MTSAHLDLKKQLDALMGTDRNEAISLKKKEFTDDDICKNYLCGLCPYELFRYTKNELGECSKKHSEPLKIEYEAVCEKQDYGYESELEKDLEKIIADCERKIEKATKKLEETEHRQQNSLATLLQMEDQRGQEIKELISKAEKLGEEGKVNESVELMNKAEKLKAQLTVEQNIPANIPIEFSPQQQKLRVCEVCAAYLSAYDSDKRLADHLRGKLHMGFVRVREKLKELKETKHIRAQRQKMYQKEKERDRKRERDYYERDRNRDYRDSHHTRRSEYRDRKRDRDYYDRKRRR